ncbi:hypothetical protein PSEUBRA_005294 [Kalmanozyma brasiliensis GHG001]|uniref:GRAM domain-containing protein n=1 Tax=Kalmanozyma brasiliensis (strain GHG001) TaxID=1365824 RepID=V5E5W6_KALBG|nr:uncharacterized protein PSEUBRA_005294 [Kalmanozyma brasiliensis GHG001]EST05601.1 hypothetical protein PSEUBRA_005294 [Kalmanozyma brasiliensis GHG001]
MALNWVMLDHSGRKPLPLPQEQVLAHIGKTSLQLDYASKGISYRAEGDALITSHRFVFIRQAQATAPPDPTVLKSLSVPLDHFQASKFIIPIFTAAYLQADVYSVPQGGLPERQPGEESHPVGKLKLWFMESGGIAFRDAVDKARTLWQKHRQEEQDENALPAYEPPAA